MSLTSALFASVAGIQAQSVSLSAISENIANSTTTAYKTRDVNFESLVTNSFTTASNFSSGSVLYDTYQNVDKQGLIEPTGESTDIAINGAGFFVVSDDVTNGVNAYNYSRNGNFGVNADGYLVNNEGYFLYGQATDADGNITATNANDLNSLLPVNVNTVTGTASATGNITIEANLPADLDPTNPPVNYDPLAAYGGTGTGYTTTIEVFDSLGISHSIDIQWLKDPADIGANNVWQATLSVMYLTGDTTKTPTGAIDTGDGDNIIDVVFNGDGTLQYADGDGDAADDGGVTLEIDGIANPGVELDTGANEFLVANGTEITLDLGTPNLTDGLTQYSSNSTTPDIDLTLVDQDGVRYGQLAGFNVNDEGLITAEFDNGLRQPIFQVPVVTFPNPGGLEHINGSIYDEASDAGGFNLQQPGEGSAGDIVPNSLELSTTETSEEFNKMIISQQAYSAASQVLSTTDEMFNTLIQAVN